LFVSMNYISTKLTLTNLFNCAIFEVLYSLIIASQYL